MVSPADRVSSQKQNMLHRAFEYALPEIGYQISRVSLAEAIMETAADGDSDAFLASHAAVAMLVSNVAPKLPGLTAAEISNDPEQTAFRGPWRQC